MRVLEKFERFFNESVSCANHESLPPHPLVFHFTARNIYGRALCFPVKSVIMEGETGTRIGYCSTQTFSLCAGGCWVYCCSTLIVTDLDFPLLPQTVPRFPNVLIGCTRTKETACSLERKARSPKAKSSQSSFFHMR